MAVANMPECLDFLHFQNILKTMRILDDKIIYTMNGLPTESFKNEKDCNETCKEIYEQLESNYKEREQAIKNCLAYTGQKVQQLKGMRDNNLSEDESILKMLRKEQGKLKLLRMELGVEEVLRDKTKKIYYERCRQFYVPPDMVL